MQNSHGFKNRIGLTGSTGLTIGQSWFRSNLMNWIRRWLNRNRTGWTYNSTNESDELTDSLIIGQFNYFYFILFIYLLQHQNDIILMIVKAFFSQFHPLPTTSPTLTTIVGEPTPPHKALPMPTTDETHPHTEHQ